MFSGALREKKAEPIGEARNEYARMRCPKKKGKTWNLSWRNKKATTTRASLETRWRKTNPKEENERNETMEKIFLFPFYMLLPEKKELEISKSQKKRKIRRSISQPAFDSCIALPISRILWNLMQSSGARAIEVSFQPRHARDGPVLRLCARCRSHT